MAHEQDHLRPRTAMLTRGFDPRLSVGSARPAVFRSSTYVFDTPEAAEHAFAVAGGRVPPDARQRADLIYSRISHPNAEILEDQIVPLERGGEAALVFNSGMAAIMTAFFTFAGPASSIIYTMPLYGGTTQLIHVFLEPFGVTPIPVPSGDGDALDAAIRDAENPCFVFIETPANPTLTMTDIRRASLAAKRHPKRPVVMVDNTFLGPVLQHPLSLGADLCLYSATKYLSGFSDMLAGVAIAKDPALIERMRTRRVMFGNILQPDECWMLDGRLPTVELRIKKQTQSAKEIAERLAEAPGVKRVMYPLLFTCPDQVRIFRQQCDGPGAILSIDLAGGKEAAFSFLRKLKIAHIAVSLGGVETLACHPKTTTHSGNTPEEQERAGVTDGLVRISIGIEDWQDLFEDFQRALR